MIKHLQHYGQIRLGKLLSAPLGLLVTLAVQQECNGIASILISPYHPGDENDPEHTILKLCDDRLTIPVKLRRVVGMGEYVELIPQGKGQVLVRPRFNPVV